MPRQPTKSIRYRGREEQVLEVFHVRGRKYFALEKLSRRGAYRVFDPSGGPNGDYRVLYRIPSSKITRQRIESLRRMTGPTANRNFPHITDCTRVGDDLFVLMSWVWGINLQDYLRTIRAKEIPRPVVPEVVRLIRGLAHGISHYHRRANLIHGDISPANIILTSGTKQLVLIDFGSMWPAEQTAEKNAGDGITNPYAAPERIAGHAAEDFRSDIFSLSVLAYELLTLEIPYDGLGGRAGLPELISVCPESKVSVATRIADRQRLPRDAMHQLEEYLARGLALSPDSRFPSRAAWLESNDQLYMIFKKTNLLSRLESLVVTGIESFIDRVQRKS